MIKDVAWESMARAHGIVPRSSLADGSRNAIVMYHAVDDPAVPGNLSVERFREDIETISERYEIADLKTVVERPKDGRKMVALTFDDGFVGFFRNVRPVLHEYGVPATVFVTPGFLDDARRELLEARHELPATTGRLVLSEDELAVLADDPLVTIGNHTRTHPHLSEIDDSALHDEIVGAKMTLERRFGVEIDRFSYPYGDYDERAVRLVRAHHDMAVTMRPGLLAADDPMLLPRIGCEGTAYHLQWKLSDLSYHVQTGVRAVERVMSS